MNFATSAARSSAIATPTDGMVTYNQATDSLEAYNGTSWINTSGLQLIKKQTVGVGVSLVTVPDCFNSRYENYRVLYTGGFASLNGQALLTRGSGGTGTNIVFAGQFVDTSGTRTGLGSGAVSHFTIGLTGTSEITCTFDIARPFLSTLTGYTSTGFSWGTGAGYTTNTGGSDNQSISSTGLVILPNSGTITGGTIYVYGYGV
jgi:hypothetical protein